MGKKKQKIRNKAYLILVVFILLLAVLLYLASLGKLDFSKSSPYTEFKENTEQAKQRQKRLRSLINKKEKLRVKLGRKYKRIYFYIRLCMACLFLAINVIALTLFKLELGELLNWNQLALIMLALVSFIRFGSIADLKGFLDTVKTKIENLVYGKYFNIEEQIESHKEEESQLQKQIY